MAGKAEQTHGPPVPRTTAQLVPRFEAIQKEELLGRKGAIAGGFSASSASEGQPFEPSNTTRPQSPVGWAGVAGTLAAGRDSPDPCHAPMCNAKLNDNCMHMCMNCGK